MGEQRKRFNHLRYSVLGIILFFACLLLSVGFYVVDLDRAVSPAMQVLPFNTVNDGSEVDRYWGTKDGIRETGFAQEVGNVYYIRTAGQLAYMSYAITAAGALDPQVSSWDYSGATFVLENDINLNEIEIVNLHKIVYPFWTPVNIGRFGKNQNITFDGNGYNIIGMRIKYDHVNTAQNVGFFSDLVGGVFKNVNFVNPTVIYSYSGSSISETDPNRPDRPSDVCVGVVAGSADSTYIKNVNIINPTVVYSGENVNAHNFCVGGAVGKLSFTTEFNSENKISSINTVTPKQWGLDTVNVKEDNALKYDSSMEPTVTMAIEVGSANGTSYGNATYGYIGGLVGVNISSKIINSTLSDFSVLPQIGDATVGTYYVGGIVGLTMQTTTSRKLIVASGIYNNLLLNVELGSILNTNADTRYCGDLVGRVYSGGWVYNNLIIGTMPYGDLWEKVDNALIWVGESLDSDNCIGHILGGLDLYYFNSNYGYIGDCNCIYTTNDEGYAHCSVHQGTPVLLNEAGSEYGTDSRMREYNFHYDSLNDENYVKFISDIVVEEIIAGKRNEYSKFDLMSNVKENIGMLYAATRPILKYEVGLTINEIDPDTNEAPTDYEKLLEAVNQFRVWTRLGDQPKLDSYFGADCSVTFIANAHSTISEAYFEEVQEYGHITRSPEKVVARSYQQFIYEPETPPVCDGYEFLGWKIPGWDTEDADLSTCPYYPDYVDDDGFYQFGRERVTSSGRSFVAIWKIKEYTVSYLIRKYSNDGETYEDVPFETKPTETVTFANTVVGIKDEDQPTSDQGLVFVGWFLEENLPAHDEDANANLQWKFGKTDGYKMPGHDVKLYAGWINNFTMLSLLLDNEDYVQYYENYDKFFDDTLGRAYYDAYTSAYQARSAGDTSNASVYLNMLQYTFANLRVDPKKLLDTAAFDDTLIENTCPFLYDYNAYLSYLTFKEIVEKYANADVDENTLKNIDGFIKYYEKLDLLFNSLKDNMKDSITTAGGVNAKTIKDLIKKYEDLEKKYEALYKAGEYEKYDMAALDSAEKLAKQRWTEVNRDLVLRDVESVVADYEAAFSNLQPKNTTGNSGETSNSGNKITNQQTSVFGMSPVLFSILVVTALAVLVFGYIGIDVMVSRRHLNKKTKTVEENKTEVSTPDDETYI